MQAVEKCRICGGREFETVMSLGVQALTGVFPKRKGEPVTSGPVDLLRCTSVNGCGLVQLKQSYDLSEMYGMNYGYRSGLNPSMTAHLHQKVDNILALEILNNGDVIIDIGSNDATTLKRYPSGDYHLIGIDPTGLKFAHYYPEEITLVSEFFSAESAMRASGGKKAKVITSFSMFYDLEEPVKFAEEIRDALDDEGIWVFEQSYLPSMLKTNSFDTICHEHLEFYALHQIVWILRKADMRVIDVEFNSVNGGSFSIVAAKKQSKIKSDEKTIKKILEQEVEMELDSPLTYQRFNDRIAEQRDNFIKFLESARKENKIVAAIGASTKGNVLLQYYGITSELISKIGEVNPDKFGCYTPGSLIPMVPEKDLLSENPDYLVVLPWHFREFFLHAPAFKGQKLVFPLPRFEIVDL